MDTSNTTTKDDKTNAATGSLTLTGKLGDVMKESCKIALTYAKSFLQQIDPNNRALRVGHIHVHVPEVKNEKKTIIQFFGNFVNRVQHQKMVHLLVVRLLLHLYHLV